MISKENINNPDYLKSSYLYNLTKFVYWPQHAFNFSLSPFIIGIYGNSSINAALIDTLREKKIHDHEWRVDYFPSTETITHCHMLFATGIDPAVAKNLVVATNAKEILIVGDNIKGFCNHGGMINLVGISPNLGYEINIKALNLARLTINQDFLELATIIE